MTKSKIPLPAFKEYEQEPSFIRIGKPYARDLLRSRGWEQKGDDWWKDPKKGNQNELEDAFFTEVIREIERVNP